MTTGMAQFVSERLGVSESLVPKWSQAMEGKDLISRKSTRYMAVEAVPAGIVSGKPPVNGKSTGKLTTPRPSRAQISPYPTVLNDISMGANSTVAKLTGEYQ